MAILFSRNRHLFTAFICTSVTIIALLIFTLHPALALGPNASFTLSCTSVSGTVTDGVGTTVFDITLLDVNTSSYVFTQTITSANFTIGFSPVDASHLLTLIVDDGAYANIYTPLHCNGGSYGSTGASNGTGASASTSVGIRTIVCNTPLYDSPGGNVIPNTAITAGQTWLVGATSQTDNLGRSWSQIYIAGSARGFVRSSCVQ